jgi:hypothetical protein
LSIAGNGNSFNRWRKSVLFQVVDEFEELTGGFVTEIVSGVETLLIYVIAIHGKIELEFGFTEGHSGYAEK